MGFDDAITLSVDAVVTVFIAKIADFEVKYTCNYFEEGENGVYQT